MILGSSKASGGKDLYYAPMTKGAAHHNDFVPEKSLDYLSGPKVDDKSKLHVGKPFKASRDEFEQKAPLDFTQTPEQEAKYYHDAQKNEKNPKPSAHESQTVEASTTSGSQRQRGRFGLRRGSSSSFRQQPQGRGRSRSGSPVPSGPSNRYSRSGRGRGGGYRQGSPRRSGGRR